MGKNSLESYLKRLQELEGMLDDNPDPDELMNEVNKVINDISKDVQVDLKEHALNANLKFVNKSRNPDPEFAREGDSGFDLRADIEGEIEYHVEPGKIVMVNTGLYFEVQKGLEIQIRPRSGLAAKYGITIVNSPGTIDSHYRGQIIIILANLGENTFVIKNGDRIAQAVVCPVYGEGNLNMIKVDKLSETKRNQNGFGSTGTS